MQNKKVNTRVKGKPIRRKLRGMVVSEGMEKSRVLVVVRAKLHPLYKKPIKVKRKVIFHDEKNETHVGDQVEVEESRPLSRRKRWRLVEVLARDKTSD